MTGKHLENNPHGVFVSTHPAAKELKIASPNLERMHERVIAVDPEEGDLFLHSAWDYIQAQYVIPMHFENPGPDNSDMKATAYFFTNAIWFFEEMQKISIREFLEKKQKTDGDQSHTYHV